jgi:S-adenosylmethionine synthetase
MRHIFTSESVTEGHPDKMADQISDAVLDAVMAEDPTGRVACEVLVTTGICVVSGEITTGTYVDVPKLARSVIADIGCTSADMGFDAKTFGHFGRTEDTFTWESTAKAATLQEAAHLAVAGRT